MTAFDDGDLGVRLRHDEHPDPLYAALLAGAADDWEAGGVVRAILAGHEDDSPASMVHLRLLAALFRVVLTQAASDPRVSRLATFYPCLADLAAATGPAPAGVGEPSRAWPAAYEVLRAYADRIRSDLGHAPQTNEVGRSLPLLVGIAESVRRHGINKVRLLEPGAAAGLNLGADRYAFDGDGWAWGDRSSPVRLSDCGAAGFEPVDVEIAERRGCDIDPVDATTTAGRVLARSFVWPSQVERHRRLSAALSLARHRPLVVDRAPAGAWIEEQLATPRPGVLTVVWHSISRQYWPDDDWERVASAVAQAKDAAPVAHLGMEEPAFLDGLPAHLRGEHPDRLPVVVLDDEPVATCHFHGPPLTLL